MIIEVLIQFLLQYRIVATVMIYMLERGLQRLLTPSMLLRVYSAYVRCYYGSSNRQGGLLVFFVFENEVHW